MGPWRSITKETFEREIDMYTKATGTQFRAHMVYICDPPRSIYEHLEPAVPDYAIVHNYEFNKPENPDLYTYFKREA